MKKENTLLKTNLKKMILKIKKIQENFLNQSNSNNNVHHNRNASVGNSSYKKNCFTNNSKNGFNDNEDIIGIKASCSKVINKLKISSVYNNVGNNNINNNTVHNTRNNSRSNSTVRNMLIPAFQFESNINNVNSNKRTSIESRNSIKEALYIYNNNSNSISNKQENEIQEFTLKTNIASKDKNKFFIERGINRHNTNMSKTSKTSKISNINKQPLNSQVNTNNPNNNTITNKSQNKSSNNSINYNDNNENNNTDTFTTKIYGDNDIFDEDLHNDLNLITKTDKTRLEKNSGNSGNELSPIKNNNTTSINGKVSSMTINSVFSNSLNMHNNNNKNKGISSKLTHIKVESIGKGYIGKNVQRNNGTSTTEKKSTINKKILNNSNRYHFKTNSINTKTIESNNINKRTITERSEKSHKSINNNINDLKREITSNTSDNNTVNTRFQRNKKKAIIEENNTSLTNNNMSKEINSIINNNYNNNLNNKFSSINSSQTTHSQRKIYSSISSTKSSLKDIKDIKEISKRDKLINYIKPPSVKEYIEKFNVSGKKTVKTSSIGKVITGKNINKSINSNRNNIGGGSAKGIKKNSYIGVNSGKSTTRDSQNSVNDNINKFNTINNKDYISIESNNAYKSSVSGNHRNLITMNDINENCFNSLTNTEFIIETGNNTNNNIDEDNEDENIDNNHNNNNHMISKSNNCSKAATPSNKNNKESLEKNNKASNYSISINNTNINSVNSINNANCNKENLLNTTVKNSSNKKIKKAVFVEVPPKKFNSNTKVLQISPYSNNNTVKQTTNAKNTIKEVKNKIDILASSTRLANATTIASEEKQISRKNLNSVRNNYLDYDSINQETFFLVKDITNGDCRKKNDNIGHSNDYHNDNNNTNTEINNNQYNKIYRNKNKYNSAHTSNNFNSNTKNNKEEDDFQVIYPENTEQKSIKSRALELLRSINEINSFKKDKYELSSFIKGSSPINKDKAGKKRRVSFSDKSCFSSIGNKDNKKEDSVNNSNS